MEGVSSHLFSPVWCERQSDGVGFVAVAERVDFDVV